ncbi:hypothetical protein KCP74_02000 [Salmonella enterica subsp. enterica]|nr:hypothetical protein KCP74_02000 [Salmonella enterica subsp. enterica]
MFHSPPARRLTLIGSWPGNHTHHAVNRRRAAIRRSIRPSLQMAFLMGGRRSRRSGLTHQHDRARVFDGLPLYSITDISDSFCEPRPTAR